jgi:hypothetical protein
MLKDELETTTMKTTLKIFYVTLIFLRNLCCSHMFYVFRIWCTLYNWSMKSDLLKKGNWGQTDEMTVNFMSKPHVIQNDPQNCVPNISEIAFCYLDRQGNVCYYFHLTNLNICYIIWVRNVWLDAFWGVMYLQLEEVGCKQRRVNKFLNGILNPNQSIYCCEDYRPW